MEISGSLRDETWRPLRAAIIASHRVSRGYEPEEKLLADGPSPSLRIHARLSTWTIEFPRGVHVFTARTTDEKSLAC